MRIDRGTACVLCLIVAAATARADEEVAPHAYVATAAGGDYYFRMVPEPVAGPYDPQTIPGTGRAYRVTDRETDEALWSTSGWYAFKVLLSYDGRYLVRIGNWPRGRAPAAEHLAIAFYDQGKLLAAYSTKDLILAPERLLPSVGHYEFLAEPPAFLEPAGGYALRLVTADGVEYVFDVQTGAVTGRRPLDAGR
jgi:hypothetical protein